jgi:CHAD domain-containing protein
MNEERVLRKPADRCVRMVALSLLADAQKAGDSLMSVSRGLRDGDAVSDAALHDFRVAIRRLRSWARAFRPWLRDDVSRKQRRRLSEIADATSATRDASVHLEWLREERPALSARDRIGHAWLRARLEERRKAGSDAALAAAKDFDAIVAKLTRRLKVSRSVSCAPERPARYGAILAEELLKESEALRHDLLGIHHATDVDQAHRARIAAKRLRYLAEPIWTLIGDDHAIDETLRALQDSLGSLHDVHVFSGEILAAGEEAAASQARLLFEVVLGDENGDDRVRRVRSRDPGPGILRLARRLHERGASAHAAIERDWSNNAGAWFFERLRDLAAELTNRASGGTEM